MKAGRTDGFGEFTLQTSHFPVAERAFGALRPAGINAAFDDEGGVGQCELQVRTEFFQGWANAPK